MYVMRAVWQVKRGRMQEAVAALKKVVAQTPRFPRRIYRSYLGKIGTITWDIELESLDEWRKINEVFGGSPEGAEFWKTWDELVVEGDVQTLVPVEI